MIDQLLTRYPLISEQVSREQVRVILRELEKALARDGAVVEFGCYTGTTSLFIQRLLNRHKASHAFHVYDSFEGLPTKNREDTSPAGMQFQAGELAVSKKQFLREFQRANLEPPVVHKAWFGELTEQDVPAEIAFAFLDGDFYTSIRDSLRLVLPRMSSGGAIVVDDYAREALPGVAKAVHERFSPDRVQTVHNLGVIRL